MLCYHSSALHMLSGQREALCFLFRRPQRKQGAYIYFCFKWFTGNDGKRLVPEPHVLCSQSVALSRMHDSRKLFRVRCLQGLHSTPRKPALFSLPTRSMIDPLAAASCLVFAVHSLYQANRSIKKSCCRPKPPSRFPASTLVSGVCVLFVLFVCVSCCVALFSSTSIPL